MGKRMAAFLLAVCMMIVLAVGGAVQAFAASNTIADSRSFTFKGSMSQKVLRSYCAHAITLAGFCVENNTPDNNFEDDLRMITDIGAKFIGRAAYFSWGGNMSSAQVDQHFATAKEKAAAAHKVDPDLILQAGVFEIAYKATVNAQAIPAYVFEAFGQPVEKRNFRFDDIIWETGDYAFSKKFWGNDGSCVPNITKLETQMYFYYQITRYIDAGFESVHLGQVCLMANQQTANNVYWDKVTTLARAYAKTHARRGIVLFDAHVALGYQLKVGDRLITDIFAGGITPNETTFEDEAQKCEVVHYKVNPQSCVGRAPGGQHPLGFTCDQQYMILEFDNYGLGEVGKATPKAFYNWGYDDVTWYALQPEWYRNQFLAQTQNYLATNADTVGKGGEQICFIQFSCRRVIVADMKRMYYKTADTDIDAMVNALDKEPKVTYSFDNMRKLYNFTIASNGYYRANNQSDICPTGGNQEGVIKEIMAGKAVDKSYFDHGIEKLSAQNHGKVKTTAAPSKTTAKTAGGKTTATASNTKPAVINGTTAATSAASGANGTTAVPGADGTSGTDSTAPAVSGQTDPAGTDATAPDSEIVSKTDISDNETSDAGDSDLPAGDTDADSTDSKGSFPIWLVIIPAAVIAVGAVVLVLLKKGKKQ